MQYPRAIPSDGNARPPQKYPANYGYVQKYRPHGRNPERAEHVERASENRREAYQKHVWHQNGRVARAEQKALRLHVRARRCERRRHSRQRQNREQYRGPRDDFVQKVECRLFSRSFEGLREYRYHRRRQRALPEQAAEQVGEREGESVRGVDRRQAEESHCSGVARESERPRTHCGRGYFYYVFQRACHDIPAMLRAGGGNVNFIAR